MWRLTVSRCFFGKFRNNSIKIDGLSPSNYFSAPALSWDAMLNMTKMKLQLIPDPDVYIFFEKVMRDGVSYIFNRYSKTNDQYLKSYDTKQESRHIMYLLYIYNIYRS